MFYQFKQAAHIAGHHFKLGVHDVPEKVEYHPYFLKLVSAGLVVEAEATKVISPQSHQERGKKLLEKILSKKAAALPVAPSAPPASKAPVAPSETPVVPVEPQVEVETSDDEDGEDDTASVDSTGKKVKPVKSTKHHSR